MSLIKDALLGGLSFLGLPKDRAVILMYHSVSPNIPYFMNVEPASFERQMQHLADLKVPVVPLPELVRRLNAREPLGGAIAITFDDGYRDNYTTAFPILKHHNFPATIYVVSGLIGKSDKRDLPRLTEKDIQELASSGLIEIGAHTVSHPRLAALDRSAARKEITDSKNELEKITGKPIRHFAYPYGSYTAETRSIVRECGFESSTSVGRGTVGIGHDPFSLRRVSVDTSTTFPQFRGKLSRGIDIYESLKRPFI